MSAALSAAAPAAAPGGAGGSGNTITQPGASPGDDTLYLVVNGQKLTTWISAMVTMGIEIMPSSASFVATDRHALDPALASVKAGDPCQVLIGSTLMLTGYVDRVTSSISQKGCVQRIAVRSKCQDLVDCSVPPASVPNMQIAQGTALTIAQQVSSAYGITVQQTGQGNGNIIPQLNVALGEEPYEVIEKVARYSALLSYDEPDGSLTLADVSAGAMASGFAEGVNVEAADGMFAMDGRFSDIWVYVSSAYSANDVAPMLPVAEKRDITVPRFRMRVVVSEQSSLDIDLAGQRAQWEIARRYGRSQPVSIQTDSWRDVKGALWTRNFTAPINLPHLKITGQDWLIAQVTFRRGLDGTHADLVMMPPQAFLPEPTILYPFAADIYAAAQAAGAAARPAGTPAQGGGAAP